MSDTDSRFTLLRQVADPTVVAALERLVREGLDAELCRINAYDFAARHGLREDKAVDTFVHASRLGLFDLSWNLLCPGCGGVLEASASLKSVAPHAREPDRPSCVARNLDRQRKVA